MPAVSFQASSMLASVPKNLAYSSEAIPFHLDLSYYESPPGIQFLHCRTFEAEGGDSTLMDAHAQAELFRARHPEAFEALSRIPATFQKQRKEGDALQQAAAASMEYRRPHIDVNKRGEILRVFWSPPFMGPLRVPAQDVEPYYKAIRAFETFIEEDVGQLKISFRLEPGTAITFNQRRMWHGREAFSGGLRHLEGTYLNIDDFKSKVQWLNGVIGGNQTSWRAGNGAD